MLTKKSLCLYMYVCIASHTDNTIIEPPKTQAYVADLVRKEPGESLLENAVEYLAYVQRIEERYLRQQGEVFTVRFFPPFSGVCVCRYSPIVIACVVFWRVSEHGLLPPYAPKRPSTLSSTFFPQFGSSECGQCAHGGRSVSDILVPVPRVVYSLRGKNVCNIACGALHNVAVTSEGRVRSSSVLCLVSGPGRACPCITCQLPAFSTIKLT